MKKIITLFGLLMVYQFASSLSLNKDKSDIQKAKDWIIFNIEDNLNRANGLKENTNLQAEGQTKSIYTKQYEQYKLDAINIDLDTKGSLTQKLFIAKWKLKYNTKYAGIGTGFLISAQDYGQIKVTTCNFIEKKEDIKKHILEYTFKVIIEDIDNKIKYNRDIKVIKTVNSFLINDVLEYN